MLSTVLMLWSPNQHQKLLGEDLVSKAFLHSLLQATVVQTLVTNYLIFLKGCKGILGRKKKEHPPHGIMGIFMHQISASYRKMTAHCETTPKWLNQVMLPLISIGALLQWGSDGLVFNYTINQLEITSSYPQDAQEEQPSGIDCIVRSANALKTYTLEGERKKRRGFNHVVGITKKYLISV